MKSGMDDPPPELWFWFPFPSLETSPLVESDEDVVVAVEVDCVLRRLEQPARPDIPLTSPAALNCFRSFRRDTPSSIEMTSSSFSNRERLPAMWYAVT
jgi:hypothetical protein